MVGYVFRFEAHRAAVVEISRAKLFSQLTPSIESIYALTVSLMTFCYLRDDREMTSDNE